MNLSNACSALEYLVGRRFEWMKTEAPDVTFVAGKPREWKIRAHSLDGVREWFNLAEVVALVEAGALVESERGVPFVLDRETKFDRRRSSLKTYIAGPNKQPMRGFAVIHGGKR